MSQVWGKFYRWEPAYTEQPSSPEELHAAILRARERESRMRVAGSFHSLNTLCETQETQILTDKLCKVLSIDKARPSVTVEGGIKLKHLLKILAQEGLTLPTQGYIVEQSIAGAIATATHGSGKIGTLSSLVEGLDLFDSRGELHHLTPDTNEHLFSAAVVGLGCLGIVYSVTLRCMPLQKLHLSKIRGQVPQLFQQLPDWLDQNDFFQIVIDPYSDRLFTWQFRKTEAEVHHRWRYQLRRLFIKGLALFSFDVLPPPSWLLPTMLKFYMALSPMKSCVDYSHRLLSPADEGHYIEEEIALPLANLSEALSTTRQIIDSYGLQGKRMVGIILVRFANADPYGYLSPTLNRQTAYISLITIAKKGYQELFKDIETALYAFKGRPHWGKAHCLTQDRIATLYPDTYPLFIKARKELDPDGLFSNAHIDALFGDVRKIA